MMKSTKGAARPVYRATLSLTDGVWVAEAVLPATADGFRAVAISDGHTLKKARARIREAIAVSLEVAEDSFDVEEDVRIRDQDAARTVKRALDLRTRAEEASAASACATANAVSSLLSSGLSVRDAGDLLQLSGARVAQIAKHSS